MTMGKQGLDSIESLIAQAEKMGYTDILDSICQQVKVQTRKKILQEHKFSISQIIDTKKGVERVRWRTFLPDENGKRGMSIVKTSREDLEDVIVAFYKHHIVPQKKTSPTFGETYIAWRDDYFYRNNLTNNTRDKYVTDYKRFIQGSSIESLPIVNITDAMLDEFFVKCIKESKGRKEREGLDYKSFGKLFGYVAGTFRYAFKKRLIQTNPMDYLDKKDYWKTCREPDEKSAETELIPDDLFDQILEKLYDDMKSDPNYFAPYAVELAAKTGARVSEIATLKWSDIDYESGYITIRRSDKYKKVRDENGNIIQREWHVEERTKTGKMRRFPIDEDIRISLERIKKAQLKYNMISEWVFPHPEYGWTHSSIISSCIKNKCKQLNFDRTYGIHAFRKTLNSDMRHDNASPEVCASMIGNTVEVNNLHYTYDISKMDEKREFVKKAHEKRAYASDF